METIVYRKPDAQASPLPPSSDQPGGEGHAAMSTAAREAQPLSAGHFYPMITEQEMVTWTHWLPTVLVFHRRRMSTPAEITNTLMRLKAPAEVIEEFDWSWKMELFDTYEVRTPVRRDSRDPLLVGRVGQERYRLALWGESLLPLEKITELVQQSLAIRDRAASWRAWILLGSAFLGLAFGLLLGPTLLEVNAISAGILFALLSFLAAWLPTFMYTPENRQHDFLDIYRR